MSRLRLALWPLLLTACQVQAPSAPSVDEAVSDDVSDEEPVEEAEDEAPVEEEDETPDEEEHEEEHEEETEDETEESGLSDFELCFEEIMSDDPEAEPGPNYDQFSPVIGTHCAGTDHQDIADVERVVFLGDSVTVGTPPTADGEMYRNILAGELAGRFGLDEPDWLWQGINLFEGTSYSMESGDFAHCAEWGARTDDLMQDGDQVLDCFPIDSRDEVTLVVMTVGGNDLASLTKGFIEGKSHDELWSQTEEFTGLLRETLEWITEPGQFENGVYVVFTNLYEFTDATGDVTACPVAGLAGFGEAVTDPALEEMVIWSTEEYMSMATDTGTDMLFLLESFCGHGYNYDDPDGRCYRGADAELWFDLTCTHPNPTGHAQIADMVMAVVEE